MVNRVVYMYVCAWNVWDGMCVVMEVAWHYEELHVYTFMSWSTNVIQ